MLEFSKLFYFLKYLSRYLACYIRAAKKESISCNLNLCCAGKIIYTSILLPLYFYYLLLLFLYCFHKVASARSTYLWLLISYRAILSQVIFGLPAGFYCQHFFSKIFPRQCFNLYKLDSVVYNNFRLIWTPNINHVASWEPSCHLRGVIC